MNMNAEQKKMYFTETAFALNREGFHVETILSGTLGVWLDDEPLCEVSEIGGITYRGENISTAEREAAKDKASRMDIYKADPTNLAAKAKSEKYAKILAKTLIRFEKPYEVPEKVQQPVAYATKQALELAIQSRQIKPQKQDVPDEQKEAPAPEDIVEVEIDQDDVEPGEVRP